MIRPQPKPVRAPRTRKPLRSRSPMKRGKALKTRAPMKRGAGPKAKRWGIKARRPRRLDLKPREVLVNAFDGAGPQLVVKAGANEARLAWCREQDCYRCGRSPTPGHPNQACHEGRTGKGAATKCPDDETFPMCPKCHREWTDGQSTNGFARHWAKARRRDWAGEQIALATSRFLSHGNRRAA